MVLGLTSGAFSLKIVFAIGLILYMYLWLHDKEKAMAVTTGIGRVVVAIVVGVGKLLYRFVDGLYRLIFK